MSWNFIKGTLDMSSAYLESGGGTYKRKEEGFSCHFFLSITEVSVALWVIEFCWLRGSAGITPKGAKWRADSWCVCGGVILLNAKKDCKHKGNGSASIAVYFWQSLFFKYVSNNRDIFLNYNIVWHHSKQDMMVFRSHLDQFSKMTKYLLK